MRINEQLNLVLPVDRMDGTTVYVHAMPIGREVFERYWLILAKTFSAIYGQGLGIISGPRVAALMLKQCAQEARQWEGPDGVEDGLVAEIRRLANVVAPGERGQGWQIYPLIEAMQRKVIDSDDAAEVDGVLVFFTLAWRLHRQSDRRGIMDGAASLWGASILSQSLSAFVSSLPTSTEIVSTGGTAASQSLLPSSIGPAAPDTRNASTTGQTTSPGAVRTNSGSAI